MKFRRMTIHRYVSIYNIFHCYNFSAPPSPFISPWWFTLWWSLWWRGTVWCDISAGQIPHDLPHMSVIAIASTIRRPDTPFTTVPSHILCFLWRYHICQLNLIDSVRFCSRSNVRFFASGEHFYVINLKKKCMHLENFKIRQSN